MLVNTLLLALNSTRAAATVAIKKERNGSTAKKRRKAVSSPRISPFLPRGRTRIISAATDSFDSPRLKSSITSCRNFTGAGAPNTN